MVISTTREVLLSQLKNTREEIVKLRKDFETLQRVYNEVAFESLSDDERKLYEMVLNGKVDENVLIVQSNVKLYGLLPMVFVRQVDYWSFGHLVHSKDNKENLETLGIKTNLLTGVNSHLSDEVFDILWEFFEFNFPSPVPIFIGSDPTGGSIVNLKKRCSAKVFDKFLNATKNYVESILEVITLFQEVDSFLQRDEITVDYLKKNFQELYKIYEDGKEILTGI